MQAFDLFFNFVKICQQQMNVMLIKVILVEPYRGKVGFFWLAGWLIGWLVFSVKDQVY